MLARHAKHASSLALSFLLMCAALLICAPAQAYDIQFGWVLICDTQEQVERFVQVFEADQELAINTVNIEKHDPNACAVVDAAYVLGPMLGVVRNQSRAFEITGIAVIGVTTPNGYRPAKPSLYFTPVNVKEFAV